VVGVDPLAGREHDAQALRHLLDPPGGGPEPQLRGAEVGGDRVDEPLEPAAQRQEHRRGGRARGRRRDGRAQAADDAAVGAGRRGQVRRGGLEAELVAVAGVDAAEQGVDQPLEDLSPEPPAHERADRLVALQPLPGKDEVHPRAHHAGRGEDARAQQVAGTGGQPRQEPCRQRAQRAARPHERGALAGGDEVLAETELAAQLDRAGRAAEQRIRADVERRACERHGPDPPARALRRVEDRDLRRVVGMGERPRGREPGDAGADDDDAGAHRAAASRAPSPAWASATPASMRVNVGSAFGERVRANARPSSSATPRASMSRS